MESEFWVIVTKGYYLQGEISELKRRLSQRGTEVKSLQTQLANSQTETRDLKGKYAELATQAEDVQRKLAKEVYFFPSQTPVLQATVGFCHLI